MHEEELLFHYDKIAQVTEKMVICAKFKDKNGLEILQEECRLLIKELPSKEKMPSMSKEGMEKRLICLDVILSHDRTIRDTLEPWMVRLANIMNPSKSNPQTLSIH